MPTPDRDLRYEPSYWSAPTRWTPESVDTAMSNADAGLIESAADVCEGMLCDDRIRGVMQTRVAALLGLNDTEGLTFEAAARVRKAASTDWFVMAPETELQKLLIRGFLLGVGVGWRQVIKRDGRWLPVLHTWHSRFLSYNFVRHMWQVDTEKGRVDVDPAADPHWILFQPYGESRPWAEGLWRPLSLYWLIKTHAQRTWAKHNDVHGVLTAELPEGKSSKDADVQEFWTALRALGRNARIMLPHGMALNTIAIGANTWETFPRAVEKADAAIAVVALGQPLTTEVPNAASTGATAASSVRQDYLEWDAEVVSTWAHDKYLTHWTEWNFGTAEKTPYLVYRTARPVDQQARAGTLKTLGEALVGLNQSAPAGKQVDAEAIFQEFNVPLKAVEKPAEPVAPPPAEEPEAEPEAEPKGEEPKEQEGPAQSPSDAGGLASLVTPSDVAAFVTVNEARLRLGLPPLPDGSVSVLQYKTKNADKTAVNALSVALASGDAPETAPGFVRGQQYVDQIAQQYETAGAEALEPGIDELLAFIDRLPDTPDWPEKLREGLAAHYDTLSPDALEQTLEKALVLAELAGRAAVLEDI